MDKRWWSFGVWALFGSCVTAAVSGCQLWIHVDDPQCKRDETCVGLLGEGATCAEDGVCVRHGEPAMTTDSVHALPGRWSCARALAGAATPDPSRKVRVRMDVVDATRLRLPSGLIGAACLADDADCARPVLQNIAPGDDGFLELELPWGFGGYIELQAPDYLPALAYDTRPYTQSTSTHGPPMLTQSALESIAAASGRSADLSARGLALLDVRDCDDTAGDGVSFDEVNGQAPFYFVGATASADLTQTAISNQLSAGREPRAMGGFADLEPGPTEFHVVLPESGEVVSSVTVVIRAGHITYVRLRAGY